MNSKKLLHNIEFHKPPSVGVSFPVSTKNINCNLSTDSDTYSLRHFAGEYCLNVVFREKLASFYIIAVL